MAIERLPEYPGPPFATFPKVDKETLDVALNVVIDYINQLAGAAPPELPDLTGIRRYTNNFTLSLLDAGCLVLAVKSTEIIGTIPADAAVPFEVGTSIELCQLGPGTLTFAAAAGVTVHTSSGYSTDLQYRFAFLVKTLPNVWHLTFSDTVGPAGPPGSPGADGADGEGVPVGGSAGQVLAKIDGNDFNTQWADLEKPYDIAVWIAGLTGDSEKVLGFVATRAFAWPSNLAGSYATAGVAATASTTFTVYKNGVAVGAIVFAASATTATFTTSSGDPVAFALGDVVTVIGQTTPDATLADVAIVLKGAR